MVYYDVLYDLVGKKPRSTSFPIPMLRNGFYGQLGRGGGVSFTNLFFCSFTLPYLGFCSFS